MDIKSVRIVALTAQKSQSSGWKKTIKGTRISVELILELLSSGWSEQQLLESYPPLKTDHIKVVFAYLRDCMKNELFFSLTKTA